MKLPKRLTGMIFLLLSAILGSAATPVIAKLIELGNRHLIHGRNPISFCNVLFASSLVAAITLFLIYFNDIRTFKPSSLNKTSWCLILLTAFISGFIIPTLYYFGIKYGNIINVILISTLHTPLYILSGWIFLKQKPTPLTLLAAMLTMIGVLLLILLPKILSTKIAMPMTSIEVTANSPLASIPHIGELLIFLAVLFSTLSTLMVFQAIKTLPNSVYNMMSMIFGVIFFFIIVMIFFGPSHLMDLFSPFLWEWMLFYGGLVVAFRVYIKFIGLKYANISDVAISNSLTPLSSIFLSFIILGTIPQSSQILGSALIFSGIALALYGKLKEKENSYPVTPKQGASGF
jgi:drug/metabolite transporter (DMT)-like permease